MDAHLEQLAAARTRWAASRPAAYEFTIHVDGLYPPEFPKAVPFHVANGTGRPLIEIPASYQRLFEQYTTIDKTFDAIERALKGASWAGPQGPATASVAYDRALGYPTNVRIDPNRLVMNDELIVTITDFKPS